MNYYNDNDEKICTWTQAAIDAGVLPKGYLDVRDVKTVDPEFIKGFAQAHFFCGVGGWPLALEFAGVPNDFPIWTASLPCQALSCAGKRLGAKDKKRHLWPAFKKLVAKFLPAVIVGEQSASKAGRQWLAGVRADLEDLGYVVGAADLCAACAGESGYQVSFGWKREGEDEEDNQEGEVHWDAFEDCIVGAPHIRQRLYWGAVRLADAGGMRFQDGRGSDVAACASTERGGAVGGVSDASVGRCHSGQGSRQAGHGKSQLASDDGCPDCGLADDDAHRSAVEPPARLHDQGQPGDDPTRRGGDVGVADAYRGGTGQRPRNLPRDEGQHEERFKNGDHASLTDGTDRHWSDFSIVACTDGKHRRVPESALQRLVDGSPACVDAMRAEDGFPLAQKGEVPNRTLLLKGIGNMIVPQLGAIFVQEFMRSVEEMLS